MTTESNCLPIILCKCGHEFPFLIDAQVIGQAIEKHAFEHKKEYGLTREQTESLKDYLIAQAFEMAFENLKQEDPVRRSER